MSGILCLLLAITTASEARDSDKAENPASSAQSIAPDASPFQSVVQSISSVATSFGATAASKDNEIGSATGAVVWVRLSKNCLDKYVERTVDRTKPVTDYILGTSIAGKSRTTGKTRLILHPNEDHALGHVEFVGEVHAKTVGHNGPATLYYDSDSTFRARKRLTMSDMGIVASRAVVSAPTRLKPTRIETSLPRLRGRIAQRIAWRRVNATRSEADAIASDHTADDIRHGFDLRLNDALAEIQSKVRTEIAALKIDDDGEPMKLQSRSAADHIQLALCRGSMNEDDWRQIAASVEGQPEVAVRVHRSLLSRAISDPNLRERLMPLLGNASQPQADETNLKIAKWKIGDQWITLDLAAGNEPAGTTRVASDSQLRR